VRTVIGVAVAGAIGALLRWGISAWFGRRFPDFPWGTLVINVSGSFLLGVLFVVLTERATTSPATRLALTTGLMGAYTTFSTFSLETFRLIEDGALGAAAANIGASLVLGLVGVWLGVSLGRAW
jgi:fluoride exporter